MKKIIISICSLVILSFTYNSCKKDDVQPNKKEGTVEFGFNLKIPSHSSAQKSSLKAVAEPAAVIVSVKKANGSLAYNMEKVELYTMNGYYISKPLSLVPGNYTIEQFLVVDASNNVIYASPLQGSDKAYLVSQPLPISFTISKDNVTKIVPEVLSAAGATPEDFGYSTFSFEVVKTFDFLIGVFVYNESITNFEMTSASLNIVAGGKTIYSGALAAITNKVTVNDSYDSYDLTVTKDGYKPWTGTFTAAELKLYFRSEDKGPLIVVLEKGSVFTNIKYGRLYNGYAAMDVRGIAPEGWHVPTNADFVTLINTIGGYSEGGNKLRISGTLYWLNDFGTNNYLWNAKGGGNRVGGVNDFTALKLYANFWTTQRPFFNLQSYYEIGSENAPIFYRETLQRVGLSIRCIKNDSNNPGMITDIDGNIYPTVKIGDQVWMAENLIVTKYKNGDIIPEITDKTLWEALTSGAWCANGNDHSNI